MNDAPKNSFGIVDQIQMLGVHEYEPGMFEDQCPSWYFLNVITDAGEEFLLKADWKQFQYACAGHIRWLLFRVIVGDCTSYDLLEVQKDLGSWLQSDQVKTMQINTIAMYMPSKVPRLSALPGITQQIPQSTG